MLYSGAPELENASIPPMKVPITHQHCAGNFKKHCAGNQSAV
jgi:hypothetical protein